MLIYTGNRYILVKYNETGRIEEDSNIGTQDSTELSSSQGHSECTHKTIPSEIQKLVEQLLHINKKTFMSKQIGKAETHSCYRAHTVTAKGSDSILACKL